MKATRDGFRMIQHEQLMTGLPKDAYELAGKPAGPAYCPDCGASYVRGRWTWSKPAAGAKPVRCAACRRVADGLAAGFVTLEGDYFREHRDEVLRRVRRCEAAEKREHPMQRIIGMQANPRGILVTTTDVHLARRIGDAVHKAFKGELEFRYNKAENLLRVRCSR